MGQLSVSSVGVSIIALDAVTANTTASIPAGWAIDSVYAVNTTANAITGGLKIGTTDGGVDVVAAVALGANFVGHIPDATLLKRLFSTASAQTLYLQAVTLFNSASLNIRIVIRKVF